MTVKQMCSFKSCIPPAKRCFLPLTHHYQRTSSMVVAPKTEQEMIMSTHLSLHNFPS